MNSYVSKGLREQNLKLNAKATEFVPKVQHHGVSREGNTALMLQLAPNTGVYHTNKMPEFQNVVTASTATFRSVAAQENQMHGLQSAQNISTAVNQDSICGIMQRQNEITTMLMEQQMSANLPQRDITIFDGDPLQYISFIQTFEHCVEE